MLTRAHQFLMTSSEPENNPTKNLRAAALWLGLSLVFALYYGILALQKAFRADFVVQDDAREYVFWMQRFIDPTLLPNDLIAQYFKSITPPGYAAIYQVMAMFGVQPLWLSKVLPIALGLIATLYSFALCLRLFPFAVTGFIATLILNQSLWFRDDLNSATPRSFITPLFLAFLYSLIRNQRVGILITLVLQALIYPPLVLITIAFLCLRLWNWESRKLRLDQLKFVGVCIGFSAIALVPYAISSAEFAPVITRSQALTMPELYPGGRHPFFNLNPWVFWLFGEHSGIIPPLMPPLIWFGLLLPILMRYPSRFPLVQQINRKIAVLPQIIWVSLGLYGAAHLLLLRLFFPTRYTAHSFRIVLAIAAGITLTVLADTTLRACESLAIRQRWIALGARLSLISAIGIVLVFYPQFSRGFPSTNFRVGNAPLYQFLQTQPKDTLIATLSDEANNISTFAQRSVLFSREHSLPFHLGYYRQIRQRIIDVLQAQYSSDLTLAKQAIERYNIKFWLIEQSAFTPEYLTRADWLESFQPAYSIALTNLQQGKTPALSQLTRCSVFTTPEFTLLDTACITHFSRP
ncbi:hypothetical protein [Leptolyngbya sp. AS-A5]|uniref:hypothetical protein n=2 Tax=unclassified Leptolyngbya TaxID=2650499 RepID=UPI00329884FA